MPVISDEEAGQIIHSLEITPPNAPNAGIIDLGLDEFNPIPNINPSGFFDLSFLNEDLVRDGANEYTEESDTTETYSDSDFEYSDTESGPSDIEQLCKTTEKLNM